MHEEPRPASRVDPLPNERPLRVALKGRQRDHGVGVRVNSRCRHVADDFVRSLLREWIKGNPRDQLRSAVRDSATQKDHPVPVRAGRSRRVKELLRAGI
jgi:hypothetical protein